MGEKIIVAILVILAGAYLFRRFLRRSGSSCGCSGSEGGGCCGGSKGTSSGCCGAHKELTPLSGCGCGKN